MWRWVGALAFVAALTAGQGWGLLAAGDGQDSMARLGLVAAIVGPLAVEVSVLRWAWLGQRQAPLRELAGPEGFLGAAPVAGRFVRRPDLERATVRALRGGGAWAVALVGFGGTGKSTLAAVVCRHWWLRRRYRQVTFVKAGPGTAPVTVLTELARRLGVADPSYATVDQARDEIETVLGRRRLLIVLDNVWTRGPLDAVLGLGPGCRVLFTTRNRDLVSTVGAAEVTVDQLTDDQALRILATWTRTATSALPQDAYRLCERLQNLALGVAMAGAMAARGLRFTDIHARIDEDLGRIKGDFAPEYQHPTLRAAIDVSIDDLTRGARDRYLRLAVFDGRGPFPADAVAALWHPLPDPDVRDLLADLVGRSLLSTTGEGWYIAHDLQYDAIVQRLSRRDAENDPVHAAHNSLLDGYRASHPNTDWTGLALNDAYLLGNIAWHLSRADRVAELVDLLGDLRYLSARLVAHGLPDLIGDTRGTGHPRVLATARALKQSAAALTRAREAELPALLAAQLVGRLMGYPDPGTAAWADDLRPEAPATWLRPITTGALAPATGPLELTVSAQLAPHRVAFSADGESVAIADTKTVQLWEASTGRKLRTHDFTNGVQLDLNADGSRVISGDDRGHVRIWEVSTGRTLNTLLATNTRGLSVSRVAISPDGTRAFAGTTLYRAWLSDATTGQNLRELNQHTIVYALAFSQDAHRSVTGSEILTTSAGPAPRVWDVATGRKLASLNGHKGLVEAVAIDRAGTRVLTGGADRTARLWDATTGRELAVLVGHSHEVQAVALSADGTRALTGGKDRTARIWDTTTGRELAVLVGHTRAVGAVAFSHDGSYALTGGEDHTVRIWDVARAERPTTTGLFVLPAGPKACTLDGALAITGSDGRTAQIWDVTTGRELAVLKGHTGAIQAVALSPDGSRALTGATDRTARIWDVTSGQELAVLTGHTRPVESVAFSPDGTRVLTGGADRTARIWDVATGRETALLHACARKLLRFSEVGAVTFSHDGTHVLTAAGDHSARIWDTTTGQQTALLTGHKAPVESVAFNHDGTRVLTGGADNTARIWDATTGRHLATLTGHTRHVRTVGFSPDGTRAVTGADDHTVRIWDTATGQELACWHGEREVAACWSAPDAPDDVMVLASTTYRLRLATEGASLHVT